MNFSSIIVGTDNHGTIGKGGIIPWSSPKDMNWFRMHTLGKVCLAGKKTYQSLQPKGLKHRHLIEVKRFQAPVPDSQRDVNFWLKLSQKCQDCLVGDVDNVPFVLMPETMVIGGGVIYDLFLPYVDRIYHTTIDTVIPGEETELVKFKEPYWNDWEPIYKSLDHDEKGRVAHDPTLKGLNLKFQIFQRKL